MERDINVVVRIKEDGTMSFLSGDGLPLQIGGKKLYRHLITMHDDEEHGNKFYCRFEYISTSAAPIQYLDELPLGEYPVSGYLGDYDIPDMSGIRMPIFKVSIEGHSGLDYYVSQGFNNTSGTEDWQDIGRPEDEQAGFAGYITSFNDIVTEIK